MIKRIALLPLDTRPCNIKYPLYISGIAGIELILPPADVLGDISQPGDIGKINDWLINSAPNADLLILSIDMLAFGGLVHSRNNKVSLAEAMKRLEILASLKKQNPKLKIHAFSVITRLSITVTDDASAGIWADLFRYATIADRYEVLGEGSDEREIAALKKKLSIDVIEGYHRVRARNHEINRESLTMTDSGVIDMLVLCMEDAAQYGLHRKEKIALENMITDRGLQDRARVVNGTDEMASSLIARAKAVAAGKAPKIGLRYIYEEGKQLVSLYEDKPIEQVAADHVELAGGSVSRSMLDHDLKLFIHVPRGEQSDIFISPVRDGISVAGEIFDEMKREKVHGKYFSIADVMYCNGADALFMEQVLEHDAYLNSVSYSAFNTTSNSIGVALAHSIAYMLSPKDDRSLRSHREFQLYSLFNDYLYSAIVRPALISEMREERLPIHGFSRYYGQIVSRAKEKMSEAKQEHLDRRNGLKDAEIKNISFPWERLFEIDMDIRFSV